MADKSPAKEWEYKPLPRSKSFLGTALETFTGHGERKKYERHTTPFQCEVVLGPVGKNRTCWLCGFPIGHLLTLKDKDGNRIFEFDIFKKEATEITIHDRGVCEHVLPVKLAHAALELLYLTQDPTYEKLLHTEYEYAHNYCNWKKGPEYFISLPSLPKVENKDKTAENILASKTNFCDLEIKHEILDEVLRQIFYGTRGEPGSQQSSLLRSKHKGVTIPFENIVQAYCYSTNTAEYLASPDKFFEEKWFPRTKAMIVAKMNRVIKYIKEADNCDKNNNTRGAHFRGVEARLLKGYESLPRGLPGPNFETLESNFPEEYERAMRLRRAPSFNNILKAHAETRLLPFRSPSFSGYEVNYNNNINRPPSRDSKRSKSRSPPLGAAPAAPVGRLANAAGILRPRPVAKAKSRKAAKKRSNNNNTNYSNANEYENSNNFTQRRRRRPGAAAAAASSSTRNSRAEARALRAAAFSPADSLATRRARAAAPGAGNGSAAPALSLEEEAAIAAAEAAAEAARAEAARAEAARVEAARVEAAAAAAAAPVAAAPLKERLNKGLIAERRENGIYISGKTFNNKALLSALGAKYNGREKKWVLPVGFNLNRLKKIE